MRQAHIQAIDIDPALVERLIMGLAEHGAYGGTGVSRPAYSPEWVAAQDQYAAWCRDAGLEVRRDAVGNVWGTLAGSQGGPSIVSGSHIDSQRPGGRYDGTLGAVAALIAIRALKEQVGMPRRTLEALSLCEEEGSRFPTANFWGSRAITGRIQAHEVDTVRSYEGESIGDAMRAVGFDPQRVGEAVRDDIEAFLELHIEQGPILEQAGLALGVVDAITGIRHYRVEMEGRADHAGAMPMDLRRDPMQGTAEVIMGVITTARAMGRPAVTTVGRIEAEPGFPAIVPQRVRFSIDARHPDPELRANMYARHEALIREVADRMGLDARWQIGIDQPPHPSDREIVALIREIAEECGIPTMVLASGAGHDSQIMGSRFRTAMIFVRSQGGRSHTPEEFTSIEDAVTGIRILAGVLYRLAY